MNSIVMVIDLAVSKVTAWSECRPEASDLNHHEGKPLLRVATNRFRFLCLAYLKGLHTNACLT